MAKSKTRNFIKLKCVKCSNQNYYIWKKKIAEYKLNLKKFCKYCRKQTEHKETKK
ncbi:MAG: 50S ribosomal protein L33 [Patescibacteria group bacterium]